MYYNVTEGGVRYGDGDEALLSPLEKEWIAMEVCEENVAEIELSLSAPASGVDRNWLGSSDHRISSGM